MNILITGAPGSGKGTMSKRIMEHFHLQHVSTGDLFRQNIKNNTEIGKKAREYIEKGLLVPDDVTMAMVQQRFASASEQGFLMDGFPRTLVQAQAFEKIEVAINQPVDLVINMEVDRELLSRRIVGRRMCPKCHRIYNIYNQPPKEEGICDLDGATLTQRADDTQRALNVRLKQYDDLTQPILKFYAQRGIVRNIDASGKVDEVWEKVWQTIVDLVKEQHGQN